MGTIGTSYFFQPLFHHRAVVIIILLLIVNTHLLILLIEFIVHDIIVAFLQLITRIMTKQSTPDASPIWVQTS